MKSRNVVAILLTLAVGVGATNAHLARAATRPLEEGTKAPEASKAPKAPKAPKASKAPVSSQDMDAQWVLFQKSAEGRYCFFHREKDEEKSHNGHVFVSITGDTFKLEHGGLLRTGKSSSVYNEELSGSRRGDKIVATFTKSKDSAEFLIGNRTLTNNHFMAKEEVTYALEPCED